VGASGRVCVQERETVCARASECERERVSSRRREACCAGSRPGFRNVNKIRVYEANFENVCRKQCTGLAQVVSFRYREDMANVDNHDA